MSWLRLGLECYDSGKLEHGLEYVTQTSGDSLRGLNSIRAERLAIDRCLFALFPNSRRIFTPSWESSAKSLFAASTADIVDLSSNFLLSLMNLREHVSQRERPIIFLGLSIGGILVKQILLQALTQTEFGSIIESTVGVIFLGTPHKALETEEYGQVLINIAKVVPKEQDLESDQRLYNALRTNSDSFLQLTHVFVSLIDCPIYSIYETKPNYQFGVLVGADRATLVGAAREEHIPLDADYDYLFNFFQIANPMLEQLSKKISRMHQDSSRIRLRRENYAKMLPALPIKCPVCRTLSFDNFQLGLKCPLLRYTASLDTEERISLALWAHRCVLANFIGQSIAVWADDHHHHAVNQVPVLSLASEFTCSPAYDTVKRLALSREFNYLRDYNFQNIVVHADPLSDQSIGRLKEWIQTCVTSHPRCRHAGTVLPTRLLDINDLTAVKLIEHHGLNAKSYTALSHCWGSSNTFLTTRANIRSMKAGFSINGIPKTFRDAILVTQALGIRYLWIDSLCIIQGDASDWDSEGGKMADVYSSALLTISAANSDGDSQGFLAPRCFKYMPVVISASPDLSTTAYLHKKSYWNDNNQEPLDARAWTLQEQYLSLRNVRYCGQEMSWRCRTSAWNESNIDNDYSREWERPWTDLVEEFSRRLLTYDTDRLTAMAGVASSVAQRNGNIYCAGLWLQNMPDELLFERKDAKSPSGYIAPSWSWAALNGPVLFVPPRLDCYCRLPSVKILRYDIQTSAENRFGRLRGRGYLKLQAHVVHLERAQNLENTSTPNYQLKYSRSSKLGDNVAIRCKFDSNDEDNQELCALILAYSVAVPAPGAPAPSHHKPSDPFVEDTQTPLGLVVEDTQMPFKPPQEWNGLYGILICDASELLQAPKLPLRARILSKIKKASLLQYRRCGFFEITGLKGEQGPQLIAAHPIETVFLH